MKIYKLFSIPSLFFSVLLFGCNDSSSQSELSSKNIRAIDGFTMVTSNKKVFIPLDNYIATTESVNAEQNEGKHIRVTSIRNLTDDFNCESYEIADNLGFYVSIDNLSLCQYEYEVEQISSDENRTMRSNFVNRAKMTVLTSDDTNPLLPSILADTDTSTNRGGSIIINLKDRLADAFPDGYKLQQQLVVDDNSIGEVVTIDTANNEIVYRSDKEGMAHLTYLLKGRTTSGVDELKMGNISIAFSAMDSSNIIAANFTVDLSDNFIVELNNGVMNATIDVKDYLTVPNDTIIQLINVVSLTASVTLQDFRDDITNTRFAFSTSKPGFHSVTYTLSDHHGRFSVGIIDVYVPGARQYELWGDRIYDGYLFSAPLIKRDALSSVISSTALIETSYLPHLAMSGFTFNNADRSCRYAEGYRLPTSAQLSAFFRATSKPAANATENHWPNSHFYLAKDQNGAQKIVDPITGSINDVVEGRFYYTTCVVEINPV